MDPNLKSNNENPYDFIFKQDTPTGPAPQPGRGPGGATTRQLVIFAGLVVGLLIIIAIAVSIISSAGRDGGEEAISVRAYQNEIERVIEIGNKNLGNSELLKEITTLELTLITDGATISSVISGKGVVATRTQLAQHTNRQSDSALESSLQVDNHDTVYEEILDGLVADYYAALRTAEAAAKTNRERALIGSVRQNVETIYADTSQTNEESSTDQPAGDGQPASEDEAVPNESNDFNTQS